MAWRASPQPKAGQFSAEPAGPFALPPHRTHVMVFAPGRPSAQSRPKLRRFVTEPPERFVTGL